MRQMVYHHQKEAIAYITNKLQADPQVDALLISGSIAHGFNDEKSDVDMNIIVSDEVYALKESEQSLIYWESAENFYPGGYFDGKYITLDYLSQVAERGNEPTRFALGDSRVAFDKTGLAAGYVKRIGTYDLERVQENTIRFLSQFDAWKWYCGEALKRDNQYLLDAAVSKLILFAGRLILLENRTFFPYHKWFIRVLEDCGNKPADLMPAIQRLLKNKTPDNIDRLYELIKNYKDWANGAKYSWPSYFLHDIETIWTRQDEFIENL